MGYETIRFAVLTREPPAQRDVIARHWNAEPHDARAIGAAAPKAGRTPEWPHGGR